MVQAQLAQPLLDPQTIHIIHSTPAHRNRQLVIPDTGQVRMALRLVQVSVDQQAIRALVFIIMVQVLRQEAARPVIMEHQAQADLKALELHLTHSHHSSI